MAQEIKLMVFYQWHNWYMLVRLYFFYMRKHILTACEALPSVLR